MKSSVRLLITVVTLSVSLSSNLATADIALNRMLTDHMVLQRDMPVPIWGTADAGERTRIRGQRLWALDRGRRLGAVLRLDAARRTLSL